MNRFLSRASILLLTATNLVADAGCSRHPWERTAREGDASVASIGSTCCGVDSGEAGPPSPEVSPGTSSADSDREPANEARTAEVAVDPAPPAGDLRAELEAFRSVESCATEHAALDPLVGDALSSIGYETFLHDACRTLDALKAGDSRRCATIDASSLRAHCQAQVAIAGGNPEGCPFVAPQQRSLGRDPTCLAVASRDPHLCEGTERSSKLRCQALASRDESPCAELHDPAEASACLRGVRRWKNMLSSPSDHAPLEGRGSGKSSALEAPDGELEVDGAHAQSLDVTRGLVVVREGDELRTQVGAFRETGAVPHAVAPSAPLSMALEIRGLKETLRGSPVDVTVPHLELAVPGANVLVVSTVTARLHARAEVFQPRRGGEILLTVDGEVGSDPQARKVHLRIHTFVRDIVAR